MSLWRRWSVIENDFVVAQREMQIVGLGNRPRETLRIADPEDAPDGDSAHFGRRDRDLGGAVAVEFGDRLAERCVIEDELATHPPGHFVQGRRVERRAAVLVYA